MPLPSGLGNRSGVLMWLWELVRGLSDGPGTDLLGPEQCDVDAVAAHHAHCGRNCAKVRDRVRL